MTEKTINRHLHRIWYHWIHLQSALNEAHNAKVIKYPDGEYEKSAPCWALYELRERIESTTKNSIAEAVQTAIRSKIRRH